MKRGVFRQYERYSVPKCFSMVRSSLRTRRCHNGCSSTTKSRTGHEFMKKASPRPTSEIQPAYMGCRTYLKGPSVHSASFRHQFRRVSMVQTWTPAPRINSAAAMYLSGEGLSKMGTRPNSLSATTTSPRKSRLIKAPRGPTPNILLSFFVPMQCYGRNGWSKTFSACAPVLASLSSFAGS